MRVCDGALKIFKIKVPTPSEQQFKSVLHQRHLNQVPPPPPPPGRGPDVRGSTEGCGGADEIWQPRGKKKYAVWSRVATIHGTATIARPERSLVVPPAGRSHGPGG